MTSQPTRCVSVQRIIAAPAAKIFAAVANPSNHSVIDGSNSLRPVHGDVSRALQVGSVFITPMSRRLREASAVRFVQVGVAILVRGRMRNTVVEFEEGRRIAWRNFGRHLWRYELQPVDGKRTLVRETFDYGPNLTPWLLEWAGFPSHNVRAMAQTLERLDRLLTGNPQ